jgi:hypothetical protein
MDEAQIDQMQPGQELNSLVAKEIMGTKIVVDAIFGLMEIHLSDKGEHIYSTLRAYSEDLTAARRVITKMIKMGFSTETAYWKADDRPEIICKAALRAVLKKKKDQESSKIKARLRVVK